jgi:DNA processing protein
MDIREVTAEELLGPLNDVEQKHAPTKLFVAGETSILREGGRVSIVGSRKASREGVVRAKKLAKLLVQRHVVVVSGLAEGIDTAAHTGTLEAGGRTVAVIGTPLDKVYPRQNAELQDRLMEEQLVVSQFAIGYPTQRKNFPLRNRTMALISDATVIIEASDSSGSLSQGWEALRLGRGLFIAKSLAESTAVTWPEEMLNYGARVLSDETLEELFDFLPPRTAVTLDGAVSF